MGDFLRSPWIFIGLTFFIALVLSIMPLPIWLNAFRPDWLALVLIYWTMALPHRVNIGVAWFMGFVLDILLGSVMGVHAFAMALVIFVSASNFQKLRNFSIWQQSAIIFVFLVLYHFVIFWANRFLIQVDFSVSYLYPALTSCLFWLWLFPVLRGYRRRLRIR